MRKLRGEMHRRMLGNGYCARPVEMDCHFESICESCTFFVTTIEFRPTLQRQRDDAANKGQVGRPEDLRRPPRPPRQRRLLTSPLTPITRISTTTDACTARSASSRPRSSRRTTGPASHPSTTLKRPSRPGLVPSNRASAKPGAIQTLKALKLGGLKDTLPKRLALARQRKMGHAAFLELVLADEISHRESRSAMLRARTAGLDPTMRLDTWDELDDLTYDRTLLSDLTSLRFTEAGNGVLILGPVGVGKTHLATALGHIAIRRRLSVHASRADKLFARLRAARLANSLDAEIRKLARVDVLILDDFALRALDATETNDFYELVVERHRKACMHHRDLEPGAVRVADHDERRAARPVRRRPAHLRSTHPGDRGPLLPTKSPSPARRH